MNSKKLVSGVLAVLAIVLTSTSAASAATFYWSGYGNSAFGSNYYGNVGVSDSWGSYGLTYSPYSIRGGWTSMDSSGNFGHYYDNDWYGGYNYPDYANFAVNSRNYQGSYGWSGNSRSGYGSFVTGSYYPGYYRSNYYGNSYFGSNYGTNYGSNYYGNSYGGYNGNSYGGYAPTTFGYNVLNYYW